MEALPTMSPNEALARLEAELIELRNFLGPLKAHESSLFGLADQQWSKCMFLVEELLEYDFEETPVPPRGGSPPGSAYPMVRNRPHRPDNEY